MACGPYVVSYLHLGVTATRRGARLAAGDGIGTVGTTGRRRELRAHLSFGVRRASDRWAYVDPLPLLPGGDTAPPKLAPTPRRRDAPPRLGPVPQRVSAHASRQADPAPASASADAARADAPAAAPARAARSFGLPLGPLWLPAGAGLALAALAAPLVRRVSRRAGPRARRPPARAGERRVRLSVGRNPARP
jgi:hypothetical protein